MAAFIPYEAQRGHDKFEKFVMAGVRQDSEEFRRRTQLGDEPTDLQSTAHSLDEESSEAENTQREQALSKALADARRRQENEDFEEIAGLRPAGHMTTAEDVEVVDVSRSEDEGDDVAMVEDGLDGSGLSGANAQQANPIQRRRASSLGAQPTARGGGVGGRTTKRVLLEQSLADSAAKNPDGDRWFAKGEMKKKPRHQDAQERMDCLMEGMAGEGNFMREALKGLTAGRTADNPTMVKEKEFGMISENMNKLLEVKAKLVALSMDTSDIDSLIKKKLDELASR